MEDTHKAVTEHRRQQDNVFFLNQDPQIHKLCTKLKTDRWDYIKLRSIYTTKEITELRGKVQWAGETAPCG